MEGASKCFNALDICSCGRNFALKIDIHKAFDTVRWDFIIQVMRCLGFDEVFLGSINGIFLLLLESMFS